MNCLLEKRPIWLIISYNVAKHWFVERSRMIRKLLPYMIVLTLLGGWIANRPTASRAQDPTSGSIAYIGPDSNVYLYDVATDSHTPITTDGDGRSRAYLWPTWSSDGRLAFFGVSGQAADPFDHALFVRATDGTIQRAYALDGEIFTYAYWAPADCPSTPACRELAVLYTTADGLAVRIVTDAETLTVREVSAGGPHYWDWSPDGRTMFWARFGTNLETFDTATDAVAALAIAPGLQRAVDWSPTDDRLLTVAIGTDRRGALTILGADDPIILASGFTGPVSFEWSPRGDQVAFLDESSYTLAVVGTSGNKPPTTIDSNVVAFWWSPDGTQIAYLFLTTSGGQSAKGPLPQADLTTLRWYVYDVSTNTRTAYDAFFPSQQMVYYLNFFDQFSRSHRLWSPDGRYIVYSELAADGGDSIRLIDTTDPSQPAATIAEGSLGIFSWE